VAGHSALSSEDLVKACVRADDAAAWAEFIRRFQPLIAKVVARTARRRAPQFSIHLIDDLVQETYLKLCEDRCRLLRQFRFKDPGSIYGFLKVVAACVVIDHFKGEHARKRDAARTESLADPGVGEPPAAGKGTGRLSMDDHIALRQIDSLLDRLYTGDTLFRNRFILWLHYRDGMTARAIASIPWIGLNTKGVETALRRMTQLIQSYVERGE